jgi:hypothetical protein
MSDKVSGKERNFLMNEEIVNQMAEAIEQEITEMVDSILSQSSLESEIGGQIESLINDSASEWASNIASDVVRNFDYTTLFDNIDFAEIVQQAVANKTIEIATENRLKYIPHIAGESILQYKGVCPETVSELIDAIICLTADDATVMQFFNKIATLREFALAIKNKQ